LGEAVDVGRVGFHRLAQQPFDGLADGETRLTLW